MICYNVSHTNASNERVTVAFESFIDAIMHAEIVFKNGYRGIIVSSGDDHNRTLIDDILFESSTKKTFRVTTEYSRYVTASNAEEAKNLAYESLSNQDGLDDGWNWTEWVECEEVPEI